MKNSTTQTDIRNANFVANVNHAVEQWMIHRRLAELCRIAKIDKITIGRWRKDGIEKITDQLQRFADALGIVPESLWDDEVRTVESTKKHPPDEVTAAFEKFMASNPPKDSRDHLLATLQFLQRSS